MSPDVKIFDFDVWESKKIQIEAFSIQGHDPRMLSSRFLDPKTANSKLLTSWVMSQDVKIFDLEVWATKNIQIEAFSIQGHGPRMLKALNSMFLDSKTSNSKLLTSCGHVAGC